MLLEKIRAVNVVFHIIFGTVGLGAGLAVMFWKKGGLLHRRWGKVYFYMVIGMMLTAVVSNLIVQNFPFYVIGYFSFYLVWFGIMDRKEKTPKLIRIVSWLWIAKGIPIAVLMSGIGFSGLWEWNIEVFVFSFLGPSFLFFIILDLIELIQRKPLEHFWNRHSLRMLSSYVMVLMAFLVSQFSWFPGYYHMLLWTVPAVLMIIAIFFFRKAEEDLPQKT